MALFDAIVIGSGPAGTMAAWALRGKRVLVLDVGHKPASPLPEVGGNLYEERRRSDDLFSILIGEKFESLRNLYRDPTSLKLKSPFMKYVVEGSETLSPVRSGDFDAVMSFATGGLANAWGAGVYRFRGRDLDGFPVTQAELDPFYEELTEHIGISGTTDDLSPWMGDDSGLQPPVELSHFASDLLAGYRRKRNPFRDLGITIGQTRNAVLTRPHRGRQAYRHGNFEFFRPYDSAVYNPAFTVRELVETNQITYETGYLALRYLETSDAVEVTARKVLSGCEETFSGRTLILAAGALNSAKLALASQGDYETRLPLLDNPMACLPLLRLRRIGQKLDERDGSLSQLIVVQEFRGAVLQGSVFGTAGPLRSDVLFDLPLSVSANASLLRRTAAATGLLMMFFPAAPHADNYLRLGGDGVLEIHYGQPEAGSPVRREAMRVVARALRRAGLYTLPCQYPPMGSSIHYAGPLPMQESPGRYQVYPDGRLFGTRSVYVADGACFPRLPAKNLTFTIMANAMRIASRLRDRVL
jgi:choline dehydrogenase-like flavoprotein